MRNIDRSVGSDISRIRPSWLITVQMPSNWLSSSVYTIASIRQIFPASGAYVSLSRVMVASSLASRTHPLLLF